MQRLLLMLVGLCLAGPAAAAVVDAQPNGFEIREEVQVAAPPGKVYAALGQVGRWWSSQHTYSGDAGSPRPRLIGHGRRQRPLSGGLGVGALSSISLRAFNSVQNPEGIAVCIEV